MAAQHTPAPWWVTDSGVRDAGGYICHTNAATHYPDQDERYERETAERAANARLIAASPRLFDTLETLVDALTTGAGRDFIEAFVRDASAALEEAQPGWNKVDEPTASEMRAKGRVRDAAPVLLDQLQHAVRWHDQIKPADVARYKAAIAKATGSAA